MSDTESFASVISTLLDGFVHNVLTNQLRGPYDMIAANIERLKRAHDREVRDTAQREYHRGFEDGRHSMDAEHRAVAMRLRALPMNRVEYGSNLYDIIEAVCGTNKAGDVDLRDKLIELMGGVSDENVHVVGLRCDDGCMGDVSNGEDTGRTHDSPSNLDRNHMAVREGVDTVIGDSDDTCACAGGGACADCDGGDSGEHEEVTDERLADDSGADTGCGDGGSDLHMAGLDEERCRVVAELRKMPNGYPEYASAPFARWYAELCEALGVETGFGNVRDQLIHLLGGDQPSGIDVLREMEEREAEGRITDELREWMSTVLTSDDYAWAIADRIDAQFDRICQQHETVLQSTIEGMVKEYEHDRLPNQLRIEKLEAERDELSRKLEVIREYGVEVADATGGGYEVYNKAAQERDELQAKLDGAEDAMNRAAGRWAEADAECRELQAKLDEYDSTHVKLPMDANGEVFRVGCTVRMVERHPEVLLTVHSMTLNDEGEWLLFAWDDEDGYSCNLSSHEFEVHDRPNDTAESIVRDLSIGLITESEAIERIEALNGLCKFHKAAI